MTKMKWETKNKINKTAVWIVLQNIFIITTSWLNIWNPFNYFWNIKSFTDSLKQQYQKKDTYLEHEGKIILTRRLVTYNRKDKKDKSCRQI